MCVGFCSCVISKKDIVQAKNVDLLKMLLRRPFQRPKKKKRKKKHRATDVFSAFISSGLHPSGKMKKKKGFDSLLIAHSCLFARY